MFLWRFFSQLIFIFIILISFTTSQLNIPKEFENEPNLGKPGVRARLSQKGINYVTGVLANSLITEIVVADVAFEPILIEVSEEKYMISKIKLKIESAVQNLRTTTKAPNEVFIEVPDIKFTINTQLNNSSENNVQFEASNVTVLLVFSVLKTTQGSLSLRVNQCQLKTVSHIPINVILNTNSNFTDMQKKNLQSTLETQAQELLNSLICTRIGFVIDDRFNDRFSLLPSKVTLAQVGENQIVQDLIARLRARRQRSVMSTEFERMIPSTRNSPMRQQQILMSNSASMSHRNKRGALMNSFNVSHVDNLFLDYTIFTDPHIDALGFVFESSGEVSLRGRGGTPFGAVDIQLPDTINEEYMLQMAVSDFVPNSLMYHGHTIGLFNARIDPKTPHFGSLMRTTCTMSAGLLFCLGDIFPTLRRLHPNHHLVLFFNTIKAPVIRFQPPTAGGIIFRLNGRIVVLIIDNADPTQETQVAEMALDINAHMKMRLINGSVRPKILLDSMKLTTLSPGVLLQEELDDAVMLAREVLQRIANDVLKDGFPVPVHPLFKLNQPKVRFLERTMLIQAQIELNERLLRQLTAPDILAVPEIKQLPTTANATKS